MAVSCAQAEDLHTKRAPPRSCSPARHRTSARQQPCIKHDTIVLCFFAGLQTAYHTTVGTDVCCTALLGLGRRRSRDSETRETMHCRYCTVNRWGKRDVCSHLLRWNLTLVRLQNAFSGPLDRNTVYCICAAIVWFLERWSRKS